MHELEEAADGIKRVEDMLCRIRELCEMGGVSFLILGEPTEWDVATEPIADAFLSLQELLEGLEPFLAEYLTSWNGASHREVIFDLVSLLKPRHFEGECHACRLKLPRRQIRLSRVSTVQYYKHTSLPRFKSSP